MSMPKGNEAFPDGNTIQQNHTQSPITSTPHNKMDSSPPSSVDSSENHRPPLQSQIIMLAHATDTTAESLHMALDSGFLTGWSLHGI